MHARRLDRGILQKVVDQGLSIQDERGATNPLQTCYTFAPSSHASLCNFPTLQKTGPLTTPYSSLLSFVSRPSSRHPTY